jgi:AmpD protein
MSDSKLWRDGWYTFAQRMDSPNFGARATQTQIDLIVIHSISLPPGQYGGPEVMQLFTNCLDWDAHPYFEQIRGMEVSAHFFIRRNGDLIQFVSCHDRAWHAGKSSYRGRDNCNDDSIGIELEGLEGESFEAPQYETLQSLCSALIERFDIAHIAGHEHIAPGRKKDPGENFDWQGLSKALSLPTTCFPFDVVSKIQVLEKK